MELQTYDVMKIVNDNHERFKEQEKIREEKKQQLIEKKQKVERVKKTAIILGLGFVLGAAPTAKKISDGHNEIVTEFDEATSEYGVYEYSDGYKINRGTAYVGFDEGINGMIDVAREKGMNDVEIAIGLNSVIKDSETKEYIDTSLKDRCSQCIHKSIEKELSGEYKNGK